MNNHINNAQQEQIQQLSFTTKQALTKPRVQCIMEPLLNISGFRTRQSSGFFVPIELGSHVFYDGSREPNKTPKGNKLRRLISVVEARHPILGDVKLTKISGVQS